MQSGFLGTAGDGSDLCLCRSYRRGCKVDPSFWPRVECRVGKLYPADAGVPDVFGSHGGCSWSLLSSWSGPSCSSFPCFGALHTIVMNAARSRIPIDIWSVPCISVKPLPGTRVAVASIAYSKNDFPAQSIVSQRLFISLSFWVRHDSHAIASAVLDAVSVVAVLRLPEYSALSVRHSITTMTVPIAPVDAYVLRIASFTS